MLTCLICLLFICCNIKSIAQDVPENPNCSICQELMTYPQLASLNSGDGQLSQLVLGQLCGTEINLTALNWQGVTQGNVNLLEFLNVLKDEYSLSSPSAVLNTELEAVDIINGLATLAQNDGSLALLNQIAAGIGPGTIKLNDLITVNTVNGDLADLNFDLLTLVTGIVQLYNYNNVLVTNDPLTLDLGLLGMATLWAQVVEPPHIGCGATSDTFYSAGIRMKLDIDLVDQVIFEAEIPVIIYTASVSSSIENISIYIDVASGEVSINSVNASTQQFNINVKPGLATAFIGNIEVDDFFDRTKNPIDNLEPTQLGKVAVNIAGVLSDTLALNVKSYGDASNGTIVFQDNVPFASKIGSSSTTIANLVSNLLTNSEVTLTSENPITGFLLAVVSAITNDVIDNTNNYFFTSNTGKVYEILESIVDPLLNALGIGIGEIIIQAKEMHEHCYDFGDGPDTYSTLKNSDGAMHLIAPGLFLGSLEPSPSTDGVPSSEANLDPNDDGLLDYWPDIDNGEYQATIDYTNNTSDSAMIVAWIDINEDGVFDNMLERSVIGSTANVPPNSVGTLNLTWNNLPNDTDVTNKFMRIRISSDPNLQDPQSASASGYLSSGEVEDYLFNQPSLDLELIRFDGYKNNKHIQLYWQTQSELNFSGFEIQQSFDTKEYKKLAWIEGKSKNGEVANYFHQEIDRQNRKCYIRLKMIDLDGSFSYSDVILINNQNIEHATLVYPVPTDKSIYIESDLGITSYTLINMSGEIVREARMASSTHIMIDITNVASGIYMLNTLDEYGSSNIHKVLKN